MVARVLARSARIYEGGAAALLQALLACLTELTRTPLVGTPEVVASADEGTRTPTGFRPPGPKPGAYTNSATSACVTSKPYPN